MVIVSSEAAESPVHAVDVVYKLGDCTRCELKCFGANVQALVEG